MDAWLKAVLIGFAVFVIGPITIFAAAYSFSTGCFICLDGSGSGSGGELAINLFAAAAFLVGLSWGLWKAFKV